MGWRKPETEKGRKSYCLSNPRHQNCPSLTDWGGWWGWLGGRCAAAGGGHQRHCPALAFTSEKEIPLSISMSKRRGEMRSCQEGEDHECLVVMAGMSEKGFALIAVFNLILTYFRFNSY